MIAGPPVSPLAIPLLCLALGHGNCVPPAAPATPRAPAVQAVPALLAARSAFEPADPQLAEALFAPVLPPDPSPERLALASLLASAFIARRRLAARLAV